MGSVELASDWALPHIMIGALGGGPLVLEGAGSGDLITGVEVSLGEL